MALRRGGKTFLFYHHFLGDRAVRCLPMGPRGGCLCGNGGRGGPASLSFLEIREFLRDGLELGLQHRLELQRETRKEKEKVKGVRQPQRKGHFQRK